jgi:hypothetical protein
MEVLSSNSLLFFLFSNSRHVYELYVLIDVLQVLGGKLVLSCKDENSYKNMYVYTNFRRKTCRTFYVCYIQIKNLSQFGSG